MSHARTYASKRIVRVATPSDHTRLRVASEDVLERRAHLAHRGVCADGVEDVGHRVGSPLRGPLQSHQGSVNLTLAPAPPEFAQPLDLLLLHLRIDMQQ